MHAGRHTYYKQGLLTFYANNDSDKFKNFCLSLINDKTIIELCYGNIQWCDSTVLDANNWSAAQIIDLNILLNFV